ncbi:hypothetical protein [Sphaerotilus montanus]|uniref:Protein kinase domain-containing protein n=2 Tax=Sphaerotilus montanus TaxID=522889 RepID=A0A7Y9UDL7_9BURK|nr:hypothetical protein [Sphaerotilus montanus]NYG34709.1 hypothetical protein [Sphaerotilus montanus]
MSPHPAIPSVPVPLAPGSCLGAYELGACHGEDLDGFDYDAVERHSGRAVTIREGCPVGLVARVGAQVVPVPGAEDDFRDWLARWTRLTGHWEQAGRSADLARLAHSALVRIEARGEANGTAWVCLSPATGRTLRQVAEAGPGWPDRATVDAGLHACCNAVESLHRLGELHGSLTPERVVVLDSGTWCLPLPDTDPSRQPLSPWLALEQTEAGRLAGLVTGPWTDVHAVAALAHWLLTGSAPPSLSRRQADAPDCWAELERAEPDPLRRRALRSALAPKPADRLGSIAALRMALGWSERHAPSVAAPKPAPAPLPSVPPAPPAKADRTGLMTLGGLLVSLSAVFAVLWINRPPTAEPVAAAMADALDQRPAGAGHRVPPVPPPPLPVKPKAPPKPPAPPQVQAPAPTPKPKQASVSPVPELPPTTVRPTEVAARKKTSEACIDWLRRRSLEPAGSERTSNPACE